MVIDSFDEAVACAEEALGDPGGLRFTQLPGLVRFVEAATDADGELRPHGPDEFESAVRLGRMLLELGLLDEAQRVFGLLARTFSDELGSQDRVRTARFVGALGASLGLLDEAREVLLIVMGLPSATLYDTAAVLANLAAVEVARGDLTAAEEYTEQAGVLADFCEPQEQLALRELLAAIKVRLSRETATNPVARSAAYVEVAAFTWEVVEESDEDGPKAFLAVARLAMVRVESAVESGDAEILEDAVMALEVASQRLAALLGADHPSALGVQADLAAAQLECARIRRSPARLLRAVGALESVTERLGVRLGPTHPRTATALGNLVIAQVESVRAAGEPGRAEHVLAQLADRVREADSQFGEQHPVARLVRASFAACRKLAVGAEDQGRGGVALLTRRETPEHWPTESVFYHRFMEASREARQIRMWPSAHPPSVYGTRWGIRLPVRSNWSYTPPSTQSDEFWRYLRLIHVTNRLITGTVVSVVPGGLVLDIGVRAVMTLDDADQLPARFRHTLVGQRMEARIVEMDSVSGTVVLSRKARAPEGWTGPVKTVEPPDPWLAFVLTHHVGQILRSTVVDLHDRGVEVSLNTAVTALVPAAELPDEPWGFDDAIFVKIIAIDSRPRSVTCSVNQANEAFGADPFETPFNPALYGMPQTGRESDYERAKALFRRHRDWVVEQRR